MKFVDLGRQFQAFEGAIRTNMDVVLESQAFINGPAVRELEQRLADYVGVKHCLGVSSGTDALIMALMALDIGPGDAVFCPTFTFIATAEAITIVGATPVFVDVRLDTFNLCAQDLERRIDDVILQGSLRPRAVMPVDLFGLLADYPAIDVIAKRHNLRIIEDGAQGFGATLSRRKGPSFGDIGTTSFFPAKPLGCFGDGGAVFTDDDQLADVMRSIRVHGQGSSKYDNVRLGLTARLDTLQAAVVLAKLDGFDAEFAARDRIAATLTGGLKDVVHTPILPRGHGSAWAQYTIRCGQRDALQRHLQAAGIPTMIYYQRSMHRQSVYRGVSNAAERFPNAERLENEVLSLPVHPYLTEKEVAAIVDGVCSFEGTNEL
ncbi:DegT/DnrJ/EryC1/StrS family aminotransferase [Gammaproteobacteria bacterium]|nr:DegT/DnrJ/EryC1/StrS family aminotransferase [Gammaproteobacteria bacterium]